MYVAEREKMQYFILVLFALFFAIGLYLLLTAALRMPTYQATKVLLGVVRQNRKAAKNSDAILEELAAKLAKGLPISPYRQRKLTATLRSAELPMTAGQYLSLAIVKAGLVLLCAIPCLFFAPILSPVLVAVGIGIYFSESGKAEKLVAGRRAEIEYELPRFVATLAQELMASRDVLSILETYRKNAGIALKNELAITISDMRTGNYEGALTRLEARVSSAMLSDVVRGLIGVLRGDDGVAFFRMLAHDMKQLELQRLKKLALERPPKIRRYSFLLLGCMILVYMGVMGYQIIGTMSGIF